MPCTTAMQQHSALQDSITCRRVLLSTHPDPFGRPFVRAPAINGTKRNGNGGQPGRPSPTTVSNELLPDARARRSAATPDLPCAGLHVYTLDKATSEAPLNPRGTNGTPAFRSARLNLAPTKRTHRLAVPGSLSVEWIRSPESGASRSVELDTLARRMQGKAAGRQGAGDERRAVTSPHGMLHERDPNTALEFIKTNLRAHFFSPTFEIEPAESSF